jgi:WD40 repeat protein/serine/threonine protein kinase
MASPSISIVCPSCGARNEKAPATLLGRHVRCPRCSNRFKVEEPGPLPTVPEVDAPLPTSLEGEEAAPAVSDATTSARLALERFTEWQVGDVLLDLYAVEGVLGEGGMGRVYKVRHRGWEMDLAAKVPRPAVLEVEGGADLFEREAETWVNLGLHPHTVTCFYVRRLGGIPVVFAEFVDGGSMHDRIRARKLASVDEMLDVSIQFAWGLHYAHEQGLVHLDVKPANVMITSDGVAKVTDFGLARARRLHRPTGPIGPAKGGDTLTVEGAGGGTPAYMSPEQAAGHTLTRRSDLWSWALSILEMFAGHRTWEWGVTGPDAFEEYLVTPAAGLPDMPEAVIDLLRRCFREDPEERPRSLADAAAAMRDAYEAATGRPYARREPRSGQRTPDALNNRAVSLLDLGRDAEATTHWKGALEAQPHHVEATYNQSLTGWTSGQIDDDEMLRRMGEARTTHAATPRVHHLVGRLHLALGEPAKAMPLLDEAARLGLKSPDLERDLGLALVAASHASDPREHERRLPLAQRAEDCFSRLLEGGSSEAVDVVGYVVALRRRGQEEKARRFYEQAAVRNADLPPELALGIAAFLPGEEGSGLSLRGLPGPAAALAVTPDGSRVLAGQGLDVRLWDTATGSPPRPPLRGEAPVRALAVTPDGRFLLWAGENAAVAVWDMEAGRAVRSWQRHTGFATAIALAPDGRHAVTAGSDRGVRLFDLVSGQCLRTMEGHEDAVTSVAVGPTRAVSGSDDGTVRVWDLSDGRCLGVLLGHKGPVSAVALAEPQARVVSAGTDHTVRDWGLNSFELVRSFAGHTQPVRALLLSPAGNLAWSGALDQTLRSWDLDRERLHSLVRLDKAVQTLAFGRDGLVWAGHGAAISGVRPFEGRLPPLALAKPVSAVEVVEHAESFEGRVQEARRCLAGGDLAQAVELLRAARAIPGHERAEAALALWDELVARLPRKGLASAWEEGKLEGHTDQVLAVAMSADGSRVLSSGMDQSVRLWDLATRKASAILTGHQGSVTSVASTRDGRLVVSGSWDRTVRAWDLATGRPRRTFEGHEEYVTGVDVSPDGTRAVSGSWDQTVRVWRLGSGTPAVFKGHASNVSAVAFGPDGRFVVSGGWDSTVRAWDVESGQAVCLFEGHEGNVTAVAASPSGRQVASGGQDTSIRLWDPRSRRCLEILKGHEAEVTAVAFTPDGRYLVSASRDQSVRVWDLEKGTGARTLPHPSPVLGLALGPSGNVMVSGGADRVLRAWHLDWEPGGVKAGAWDDGARPFLETFVSVRLKPETVRAATRAAVTDAEVDAVIADLKHRGFGSLRRETVAGKLQALATESPSSFWDDVRKSAPRVPSVRPAPVVETVVRRVPWGRIALGLLALAGIGIGVSSWIKPKAALRVVPYMAKSVVKELEPIDLAAFTEPCSEPYETYRDLAQAKEVGAPTLACLAQTKQPAALVDYLAGAPLTDPADPLRDYRLFRNAVSLALGLGNAAVEPLCTLLADGRERARRIAATSLARLATPEATACLGAALAAGDPITRATAASVLRTLLANQQLGVKEGFALVQELLRDPDPTIRAAGLRTLPMFNAEFAAPLAAPLVKDPDRSVAQAADEVVKEIETVRRVDLLRTGQ